MDPKTIQEIRSFNRYYTIILGLLDKHLLQGNYTLVEARVMFELSQNKKITSSKLIQILHIDKGYLSRVLKKLQQKRIVKKVASNLDKRQLYIELTKLGKKDFKTIDEEANLQIALLTKKLSIIETRALVSHMKAIRKLLSLD